MNNVDFLVIIPTFRRPIQLASAINSALNQPGVSKMVVVVDDCPDGSAEETARGFQVHYIQNPTPSGGWPGRVRNYAFDHLSSIGNRSRYVHFLDDDDTVPSGHYATVKETFEKRPDVGVIFGVLRPFCDFSADPVQRAKQEQQLQHVCEWRKQAARFPWIYEAVKVPALKRMLYNQHAMFGPEMFLCSGGIIRSEHVFALGGFPDVRITQDYEFFTEAIRRFGVLFLKRETAGYGVGSSVAVWNPLDLTMTAKVKHVKEWTKELSARGLKIQQQVGKTQYHVRKVAFRGQDKVCRFAIDLLNRRGYFADLDSIIEGRH